MVPIPVWKRRALLALEEPLQGAVLAVVDDFVVVHKIVLLVSSKALLGRHPHPALRAVGVHLHVERVSTGGEPQGPREQTVASPPLYRSQLHSLVQAHHGVKAPQ